MHGVKEYNKDKERGTERREREVNARDPLLQRNQR